MSPEHRDVAVWLAVALAGMPLLYGIQFGFAWLAGLVPGLPWLYFVFAVPVIALPAAANVAPSAVMDLKSDHHPTVVVAAVAVAVAAISFVILAPGHALSTRGDVETCAVERFDYRPTHDDGRDDFAVLTCPSGRSSTTFQTFDLDVGDRIPVAFHPDDPGMSLVADRPAFRVLRQVAWVSSAVVVAAHLVSGWWFLLNRRRSRTP
ncbi:hypothetical protein ABZ816_16805 [Actinosynnema sp. NPDC047251]|uniref:hypothetical protein n=1 Tax=Saccharothrix espanaensis TaxID=103731 RepID=UPI001E3A0A8C|nr:hypothetical protein [Saccharothrix espanaensis]